MPCSTKWHLIGRLTFAAFRHEFTAENNLADVAIALHRAFAWLAGWLHGARIVGSRRLHARARCDDSACNRLCSIRGIKQRRNNVTMHSIIYVAFFRRRRWALQWTKSRRPAGGVEWRDGAVARKIRRWGSCRSSTDQPVNQSVSRPYTNANALPTVIVGCCCRQRYSSSNNNRTSPVLDTAAEGRRDGKIRHQRESISSPASRSDFGMFTGWRWVRMPTDWRTDFRRVFEGFGNNKLQRWLDLRGADRRTTRNAKCTRH